jgi:hypothetical protein
MTTEMRSSIALVIGAVSLTGFAVCLPSVSSAQAATGAVATPLQFDPAVTIGKLSNGMRYYIRNNKKPEKRAELRLVVKAGSILEDDGIIRADLAPLVHQDLTALTAQQTQLQQRRQRLERQTQRLLDAYQTEIITLHELQLRRQKLTTELQQVDRELQQLTHTQQQTLHWQEVIDHVEHFRHLLGKNLDRLSFADRQTVVQCLIKKIVVTGEHVNISYVLPFDQAPQVYNSRDQHPEGTPGHFYRLRLADLCLPA